MRTQMLSSSQAHRPMSDRWSQRNGAARFVRILVFAVPIGASIGAGALISGFLPHSSDVAGHVLRLVVVIAISALAFVAVERMARRFLPLAMLLKLSLIFPDQAPSRFAIALRASSPRQLRQWALEEHRNGMPFDAHRQAEFVLTKVVELGAHDRKTRGHSERVQALTDLMAIELGLSEGARQRLRWAALLHDIGKLSVPTEIINDPGKPDDAAMAIIREHPLEGAAITEPLASWLGEWRHGIDQHHERWDGTGYPAGLAGHEISLAGRIVAVTDAFETMTAVRSYKKAMSVSDARAELVRSSGTHFDPEMVRCFLAISIGRLRWTTGAIAGLAELPFIGLLPRAGTALLALGALMVPTVMAPSIPGPTSTPQTTGAAPRPGSAAGAADASADTTSALANSSPSTSPTSSGATSGPPVVVPNVPTPEEAIHAALAALGVHISGLPLIPDLDAQMSVDPPVDLGGDLGLSLDLDLTAVGLSLPGL